MNIPPEKIESIVSVDSSDGSLTLRIKLIPEKDLLCPYCKNSVKIHGYSQRKLIHSTLVNRKCTLFYSQRRYKCDDCDITFSENNPFINSSENITIETKINVLKDLKYVNSTYTSVATRYNLSVTKVMRIFDNHVQIERKALPRILSIDEHYFPESDYDSLYCCLLMDFSDGTLIDVLPNRKKEYLNSYFSRIKNMTLDHPSGKSELNNVE